jgi:hypothetical protein
MILIQLKNAIRWTGKTQAPNAKKISFLGGIRARKPALGIAKAFYPLIMA